MTAAVSSELGPRRYFWTIPLLAGASLAGCLLATPAVANPDPIAAAVARVSSLESESALASQQAVAARAQVDASQQRLRDLQSRIDAANTALAASAGDLEKIARTLYINGGIGSEMLHFTLNDPDAFLADLEVLSTASAAQNEYVASLRTATLELAQAKAALATEHEQHAQLLEHFANAQAAAGAALDQARNELNRLQEEERKRVAEEVAARAAAAAAATSVASSAFSPLVAAAPATVTDPMFAEAAAWASGAKQQSVIMCESGGNYRINTGNGYYGAWQFDYPSWHANGGGRFAQFPHQATKEQQDFVAWTYWKRSGWRPWACA